MEVALAKGAASQLVSAVEKLQAAVAATKQNDHECRMIVHEVVTRAPFITDLLNEARHFEDEALDKAMALNLNFAVDAVNEATMAVYKWLMKPFYQRLRAGQGFQPALKNAKESLFRRLETITAHQIHRLDKRAEQMAQLAVRNDEISRVFEALLSGTQLNVSTARTMAIAKAQLEQASYGGQKLRGHTEGVYSIAWSSDGSKLATASRDNTGVIWDATTGERLRVLESHIKELRSIAWSADGSKVATCSADDTGAVWDAASGKRLKELKGHNRWVPSVAWSPEGRTLAWASRNRIGVVCPEGKRLGVIAGHTNWVKSLAWSPDGSKLAMGYEDKTGAILDVATGERLRVLEGHTHTVQSIAWSPDGSKVATASLDKTGAVWDAATGERLRVLQGHNDMLFSIAWSPDGSKVATTSADKTARIWAWQKHW